MEQYHSRGLLLHCIRIAVGALLDCQRQSQIVRQRNDLTLPDILFGTIYLAAMSLLRPLGPIASEGLLAGCYIGIFEMGLPFICFGIALRTTDNPALVNQLCYLAPFLSLFFVALFVGETIMPSTYIGLILIVGGIICNRYLTARNRLQHT